jgi:hypothetical protein
MALMISVSGWLAFSSVGQKAISSSRAATTV